MSIRRTFAAAAVGIALASAAAAPVAFADPDPVLGQVWGPNQRGYGTVRPAAIDHGSHATTVVTNISWSSWGGPQATGTGTALWVPPGQPNSAGVNQPANIVAYNLGTCNGKPAYRTVKWYFPGKGETFNPSGGENICRS